ncbi:hypothetical protein F7725_022495, partial [Dissostichus mawsoni]
MLPNSPQTSPLSPSAQPASLLLQPTRAVPSCSLRDQSAPRRDPSLTSPCWDAATFPAKHCLHWLYYVCLRRSPASRGRQRRRRETGSQSQDKEKAGRQRLAKEPTRAPRFTWTVTYRCGTATTLSDGCVSPSDHSGRIRSRGAESPAIRCAPGVCGLLSLDLRPFPNQRLKLPHCNRRRRSSSEVVEVEDRVRLH